MATPSNANNLTISFGIVSFKKAGESTFRDLGEVPNFTYTPAIEKSDYFSSRGPTRVKKKTRFTQVSATIAFRMDEIVADNLAIFALGEVTNNSDGSFTILGLSQTDFHGVIKCAGTNDEGAQVDFEANVSFTPSGDFSLIGDGQNYTGIEVTAEVLADDNNNYGTWTIREAASA